MTDRELLELAAKAAGIIVSTVEYDGETHLVFFDPNDESGSEIDWNPLDNDADAFRLAVQLGITLDFDWFDCSTTAIPMRAINSLRVARGIDACSATKAWGNMAVELHGSDACAATRRAIVRPAAYSV